MVTHLALPTPLFERHASAQRNFLLHFVFALVLFLFFLFFVRFVWAF